MAELKVVKGVGVTAKQEELGPIVKEGAGMVVVVMRDVDVDMADSMGDVAVEGLVIESQTLTAKAEGVRVKVEVEEAIAGPLKETEELGAARTGPVYVDKPSIGTATAGEKTPDEVWMASRGRGHVDKTTTRAGDVAVKEAVMG
jgi:hypothetical protein